MSYFYTYLGCTILLHLLAALFADSVRDYLYHYIGRLSELPQKVRPVLFGRPAFGYLHIEAQQHIGHYGRIPSNVEDPDICRCKKSSPLESPET